MGCCSLTARGSKVPSEGGQEEMHPLRWGSSRKWSTSITREERPTHPQDTSTDQGNGHMRDIGQLFQEALQSLDPQEEVLWGKTRKELEAFLFSEPIQRWKQGSLHSLGDILWSSMVQFHSCHEEQEAAERYLVLFPSHLLILTLVPGHQAFVYQGLLPLTGLRVREHQGDQTGLDIFGSMIETKTIFCGTTDKCRLWVLGLKHRIQELKVQNLESYSSPLSLLVPCDEPWKRQELRSRLLCCPIQQWEGKPIQHLGPILALVPVQVAYAGSREFQDRLLLLFAEDLVFLSLSHGGSGLIYQGKLPRSGIWAQEKSATLGRLEFEMTGNIMEPILVACSEAEDYEMCLFHLQKPSKQRPSMSSQPPIIPKKLKRMM
ncbi:probable pleckstrin homology domain-containing family N member 1 isoform X2 [Notamacropus eugenii]|uniref:probable pleckstrin homology domain-containing family N member 1 isoform X2 n=1 Tax=Notamacropus eugenii TaxID=9315 RepID=UPI003B6843D5